MDAGMEGMEGIPEDREGSRRDEDRAGATTGLIPFFFISLRSPLRLARALSSAVLPAALSAASLPRRFASSASICALPSAMGRLAKARRCLRTLIGRGGRRERKAVGPDWVTGTMRGPRRPKGHMVGVRRQSHRYDPASARVGKRSSYKSTRI